MTEQLDWEALAKEVALFRTPVDGFGTRSSAYVAMRRDILARYRKEYRLYIRSARWRDLRRSKIQLSGGRCSNCGAITVVPEIHHRTYERLFDERVEDLEILCSLCHAATHGIDDTPEGRGDDFPYLGP